MRAKAEVPATPIVEASFCFPTEPAAPLAALKNAGSTIDMTMKYWHRRRAANGTDSMVGHAEGRHHALVVTTRLSRG